MNKSWRKTTCNVNYRIYPETRKTVVIIDETSSLFRKRERETDRDGQKDRQRETRRDIERHRERMTKIKRFNALCVKNTISTSSAIVGLFVSPSKSEKIMSRLWTCAIKFCQVLSPWLALILADDSGPKVRKLISKNCAAFDAVCDAFDLSRHGELWNRDTGVGCCPRNGSPAIPGC